ncbi:MAG: hypothetical protein N3B10_13105 [Armatimonadetes bacterium]|nr:hypothetical protein [Armatimonadota bacterium]MCX7969405.1 hypothetical protein [Armatimonadota bacterium]MDW8144060.1 hypothetical protein [Armatimonadota bacterium]
MFKREIPTFVFIAIVILAVVIAVAVVWRKSGGRGEIVLEKAEKPYPVPPIFQKQPPK